MISFTSESNQPRKYSQYKRAKNRENDDEAKLKKTVKITKKIKAVTCQKKKHPNQSEERNVSDETRQPLFLNVVSIAILIIFGTFASVMHPQLCSKSSRQSSRTSIQ